LGWLDRLRKEPLLTDIFREVEEEVRRERLEKIWKQYGDYIIVGAAALIIAVAGFELWQRYEDNRRTTASAEYDAAVQLASTNPPAAIAASEKIAATAPAGYAKLAKFAEADALLVTGQRSKAVSIFESLGTGDDDLIGSAARLRAAWAIVEFAPRPSVEKLVAPLGDQSSAWHFMAREVLAYADYRTGQYAQAGHEFEALASDNNAPRQLRERAKSMAALIRAGGERDFGYVPPPAPQNAAPANP
jgi:hypothetical protein